MYFPLIHRNYIPRPHCVHIWMSSVCVKVQDGKISQSMFWIRNHTVNRAAAGGSAHRAWTASTAVRPAAQPSPARSGPTAAHFCCLRTSPPPVWGCLQSIPTTVKLGGIKLILPAKLFKIKSLVDSTRQGLSPIRLSLTQRQWGNAVTQWWKVMQANQVLYSI